MNIKKNIIIGIIASLVPIVIMSLVLDKTCSISNYNFNYPKTIRMLLVMFVIINVTLLPLLSKLNINNYYIIGAILSLIYSSIGRYYKAPQKILKIDPNQYQFNALILWTLYYGLFINNLVN